MKHVLRTLQDIVEFLSWAVGKIDDLLHLHYLLGPLRPMFFNLGWGDYVNLENAKDHIRAMMHNGPLIHGHAFKPKWEGFSVTEDGIMTMQGTWKSPLWRFLPIESRVCRFKLIEPVRKTAKNDETLVISLPSTGEQVDFIRVWMAMKLARLNGWSSLIVTAPYYGHRKPASQTLHYINTVADYFLQIIGIVEETSLMVYYYLYQRHLYKSICITGFSWGGGMAACSSALLACWGVDCDRIACVPYCGSATPTPLIGGSLDSSLDYDKLKISDEESIDDVKKKLMTEFLTIHTQVMTEYYGEEASKETSEKTLTKLGSVKVVSAKHDCIMRNCHTTELSDELQKIACQNGSSLEWLPGGHFSAAMMRQRYQYDSIVNAVRALPMYATEDAPLAE
jgi:hypothetical protein